MKNLKLTAAVALSLALVGCGKHITINTKSSAVTAVQTLTGALEVSQVEKAFIGDQLSSAYQISFSLTHGTRSILLTTFPTPDQNGYDSKNLGNDYYAVRTACADSKCELFVGLFNYGSFQGSGAQFAVLYQGPYGMAVTKVNEQLNSNYNSVFDALNDLKSRVH